MATLKREQRIMNPFYIVQEQSKIIDAPLLLQLSPQQDKASDLVAEELISFVDEIIEPLKGYTLGCSFDVASYDGVGEHCSSCRRKIGRNLVNVGQFGQGLTNYCLFFFCEKVVIFARFTTLIMERCQSAKIFYV